MTAPFVIAVVAYEGVDLLDVAAPCELFRWMGDSWTGGPPVKVLVAAPLNGTVTTRDGLQLIPHRTLDQLDRVDLLWVAGGGLDALRRLMADEEFLGHLQRLAGGATYVVSVCEGALLLASAGLLAGFRATTHWAFLECLRGFAGVTVIGEEEGYPRFVVDDHDGTLTRGIRVTGGGVSSGLDEALQLVSMIAGEAVAVQVQLSTQYFPAPPVHGALPSEAPPCPLLSS